MGETPTCDDIIKYCSQKTRLLIEHDAYGLPFDVTVAGYIEEGELFTALVGGFALQWFKTCDVRVLAFLPPLVQVELQT